MNKYKKKSKYNKGTQYVDVPPTMTGADVGAQALSGAASGAAMGSVAGPWGCVCAGTKVITNLGEFKNVEDLKQEDGIIGWDGDNYVQQDIVGFQPPAEKECIEIETRLGHVLRCSTDHPIYSSGQGRALRSYVDGVRTRIKRYEYIDADQLKLGDNIGLINEVPIWGPVVMEHPYLVGACIGDGTYGKNKGIRLFSADSDTWNYIESNDLGYQVDKNEYLNYNKEFRSYRLKDKIELFRELGIYEQTKGNKRLPDNIHLYDKDSVCKIIAGLIDTDGYVSFNPKKPKNGRIGFCQSNIDLVKQVREQLTKLGIHSSLKTNKATKKVITDKECSIKEAYVLIIKDKYSVINFYNNISLNISYKKENLENFYNYVKELDVKDHKELTNICADKITKITPIGLQNIYNLEASGSHTYIANLIITHNTVIGGAVGGGVGLAKGIVAKDAAKKANTKALAINSQSDRNMRVGVDSKLQNYQFKEGTKEIEIEGKGTPEIHTDKNYNIKNLGSTPHTEGGDKVEATEGDIIFNTQNSKEDYQKVMKDISLYKMKGDKNALKRLEKRRNQMPSDSNPKKAYGDNGEYDEVDLTLAPNKFVANNLGPDYRNEEILGYQSNQLTVPNQEPIQTQSTPFLGIPDMGGGRSLPSDKPVIQQENNRSKFDPSSIGRFANIGYNAIQSLNKVQPIQQRQLDLNRYKYSDMSDPLRQAIRQNRATQLYNAGRAGSSIGQQLSYAQQAENNYSDQLGQVNAGENERKQNIQNANVDLSNTENQVGYQQALQNADTMNRRRAVQQSFAAAATSETANLAEIMQREKFQREAQQNFIDRQKQYLDLSKTSNFGFNPELGIDYNRTWYQEQEKQSKGNKEIKTKTKSKYVYKSGTKSK